MLHIVLCTLDVFSHSAQWSSSSSSWFVISNKKWVLSISKNTFRNSAQSWKLEKKIVSLLTSSMCVCVCENRIQMFRCLKLCRPIMQWRWRPPIVTPFFFRYLTSWKVYLDVPWWWWWSFKMGNKGYYKETNGFGNWEYYCWLRFDAKKFCKSYCVIECVGK